MRKSKEEEVMHASGEMTPSKKEIYISEVESNSNS